MSSFSLQRQIRCPTSPFYYLPKIFDFSQVCWSVPFVCLFVNIFSHRLTQKILQLATWNFHSRLEMGRGRHLLFLGARPPRSSAPEVNFRFWRSSHISKTAAPIDFKLWQQVGNGNRTAPIVFGHLTSKVVGARGPLPVLEVISYIENGCADRFEIDTKRCIALWPAFHLMVTFTSHFRFKR